MWGRRVEFGLLLLPPSDPLSPIPTLAVLDCERMNEYPQSNYPRYPPQAALLLPSSVLYYEM
ncbi:hypothetical protein K443DRAFT_682508 [Laccaria amethystina LaAM-08-1]|uniref:Uncharacterized protein n=1 Tax=Laccaria amethystina LaAM-08-1 TaxID=1095629 RepID=A0A0C9WUU1_9AGAR|nr:hypothetical protein K443DRAFT_682508 [Laccaria amethystina LaAM-08-1]